MKAFAIVMKDHFISENGFSHLKYTSEQVNNDFEIKRFDAVVSSNVDQYMDHYGLKWTWPDRGNAIDELTGMRMHAYGGPPKRRYACSMSHFKLWEIAVNTQQPVLILEHDAQFIEKFDCIDEIINSKYEVVGINDPRRATRLDQKFHSIVEKAKGPLVDCPVIDDMKVPQGIAGGSAYVIKPNGASQAIAYTKAHGLWPNDALLCQQIFPWLGVTKTYYTKIQGLRSTTFSDT